MSEETGSTETPTQAPSSTGTTGSTETPTPTGNVSNTPTQSLLGGNTGEEIVFDEYTHDKMPTNYKLDSDDDLMTLSKELGLSSKQANQLRKVLYDGDIQEILDSEAEKASNLEKNIALLQQDWGNSFNFKINNINKLINQLDNGNNEGEVHDYLAKSGLSNDPNFVKFLDLVVSNFAREEQTNLPKNNALESLETIQDQINTLMSNKAYFDKSDPAHKSIVNQVTRLYEKKFLNEPM